MKHDSCFGITRRMTVAADVFSLLNDVYGEPTACGQLACDHCAGKASTYDRYM